MQKQKDFVMCDGVCHKQQTWTTYALLELSRNADFLDISTFFSKPAAHALPCQNSKKKNDQSVYPTLLSYSINKFSRKSPLIKLSTSVRYFEKTI